MTATRPGAPIVIVGPMGSGKTTIGQLLAARLGRRFVDNDSVLVATAGRTAAEIARTEGIDALHVLEADVLRAALDAGPPAVVTAAASTVVDPAVRERLRSEAFVVWLTAEPTRLAARTTGTPDRPLLDADLLALAEHQRTERDPLFAEVADLLVSTDGSIGGVVDDVLANLPPGTVPPPAAG